MRVRNVEPESAGRVQITVEETQQRILLGDVSDGQIQQLLLTASQDPNDPGLRSESVAALTRYPESLQIRDTLLSSLQHDSNAGVRLAALEGLKGYVQDAAVRNALSHVVLTDKNPGVRTQVIDLLIQRNEDQMTGVFQELMRNEPNDYVRLRCAKALRDMRASPGTF
jgi:HEAT repeat protein